MKVRCSFIHLFFFVYLPERPPSVTSRFANNFSHRFHILRLTWTFETSSNAITPLKTIARTATTYLPLRIGSLLLHQIALRFNTLLLLKLFHLSYKRTVGISYSPYPSNKSDGLFVCPSFTVHEINNESSYRSRNTLIRMN